MERKSNLTELVFILDRSGSMAGLEKDTIGGFNAMVKKQNETDGEAVITTVLFDDKYEILHDRMDVRGVLPMTEEQYYVRGCTALLDAVGRTIEKIDHAQRMTAEPMQARINPSRFVKDSRLFINILSLSSHFLKPKSTIPYNAEKVKWMLKNA